MTGLGQSMPSFVVDDDAGRPIEYRYHPRPTKDGYELVAVLDRALAGAQLELVPDALVARASGEQIAEVRARNVAALARHAAARIVAGGDWRALCKLLYHCRRLDPETSEPLVLDEQGISKAYQANYGELERAAAALVEAEFGGFLALRLAAPTEAAVKLETMAATLFRRISSKLREASALNGQSTPGGTPPGGPQT